MTIGDAIRLAEEGRPPDGVTRTLVRCLIYVRISLDDKHDEHGVANQMAKLEQKAAERGWTVVYRLSDNDIGVTRKDPTRPGKYRPGYEEAMRLVDARMVDAVLCFKWDRFIREPLDLEYLIPRFDKAGVRFAEVDGSIDLGTDSGRLHARIMIAVAKAEQERKAERQKLAFEQAAINGKRFTGCPRPFGYCDDHVTAHPVEGPAVAEACVGAAGRRDDQRHPAGVDQAGPQAAAAGPARHHHVEPDQYPDDPAEPEDRGRCRPTMGRSSGRETGSRWCRRRPGGRCGASWTTPPGSRRAGCGRCWAGWGCARAGTWSPACHLTPGITSTGAPPPPATGPITAGMWRGRPNRWRRSSRNSSWRRLSRPDAADLVSVEEAGVDVAGLREEAAAIRRNLEEMAGDCALGRISRAQMLKATQAGNARLAQIGAELDGAARENVLAPLVAAENAAAVWAGLDISRKRAVIKTLMSVTLYSPGKGARRAFDPATVQVAWNQPDAA